MPHWFGIRPNFRTPSGTATSAHARLTTIDGAIAVDPLHHAGLGPVAERAGRRPADGSARFAPVISAG